jgi:hypothetical protein
MTPEDFEAKMKEFAASSEHDAEAGHVCADELMCRVLRELGYSSGVEIFENMFRWYA